jgi:hypothetical protein
VVPVLMAAARGVGRNLSSPNPLIH